MADVVRVGWASGMTLVRPAQVVVFAEPAPRTGPLPHYPDDELEQHR